MARIQIPELDWDIGMGCIAGKFTTLEGILGDLKEMIASSTTKLKTLIYRWKEFK